MTTTMRQLAAAALLIVAVPGVAAADWDLMVFGGRAYPTYEEQLVIRIPDVPIVPGLDVTSDGTPEIRGKGGPVFGGALASDGVFGIEGRLDLVNVDVEFSGVRYDLAFSPPVFGVTTGRVTIGEAVLEADRLKIVSLNARIRTPGPLAVVASGGISYLPGFEVSGTVPVGFQLGGIGGLGQPTLRIRVDPEESEHSFGVNGGAGIRIGGRVGLFAEARVFYFKSYELTLELDEAQPLVNSLLENVDPVTFRPLVVNAVVGLSIRVPGL
jgi:hypothetical protein